MATSFQQLIINVELLLSQTAGTAVQRYAQPRIAKMLQDGFDELFIKRFWPEYSDWFTLALDGTTGKPSSVPSFSRFIDIQRAYRTQTPYRLRQTPPGINPLLIQGTEPLYIEGVAGDRVFRVWPRTSTTSLDVYARVHPGDFDINSQVVMDRLLMEYLAAWKYSVDDGHNPGQAEKLMGLFNDRYAQIGDALSEIPYELDPRFPGIQNNWQEVEG